jgi:hypothetical protein
MSIIRKCSLYLFRYNVYEKLIPSLLYISILYCYVEDMYTILSGIRDMHDVSAVS